MGASLGAGHHGVQVRPWREVRWEPHGASGGAVAGGGVSWPAQEDPGPWCQRVDASTQKHVGGRGLCHSCPLSIWDATGPPQGAWCVETFGVLSEPGDGQSFVPSRKAFTRDSSLSACGQAAI